MVSFGLTHHSIETRNEECHCHVWLYHRDVLAVAQQSISVSLHILLTDATVMTRDMNGITGEVMDIELHPDRIKKGNGCCLCRS